MPVEKEEIGLAGALMLLVIFLPVVIWIGLYAGLFYLLVRVSRFMIGGVRNQWLGSRFRTGHLLKANYKAYKRVMEDVSKEVVFK